MEKLESISLKSGTRQTRLSTLYLSIQYSACIARAITQEKEVKGIHFGKEEVKISVFADDMIVYLSDPKISTIELL